MGERDTVVLLSEWGKWSRIGVGSLRAGNPSLTAMGGNDNLTPDITDEDALRVDRSMGRLKMRNRQLHQIVDLYFRFDYSMREIELRMKVSKVEATKLFAHACGWIDCDLFAVSEAA